MWVLWLFAGFIGSYNFFLAKFSMFKMFVLASMLSPFQVEHIGAELSRGATCTDAVDAGLPGALYMAASLQAALVAVLGRHERKLQGVQSLQEVPCVFEACG